MKNKPPRPHKPPVRSHGLVNDAFLRQSKLAKASPSIDEPVNKAIEYYNKQQFAHAEKLLVDAQVEMHRHRTGMHVLAVIYAQTIREGQAEALWRKMIDLFNKPKEVYPNYGRLLQIQGRYEESLAIFSQGLPANEADYTTHLNMGVLLHRMNRYTDALVHANKAIALNPGAAQAYFNRARLNSDMGDRLQCIEGYQQTLSIEPTHADAYSNLLFTMQYLPKSSAQEIYQTAMRYAPAFDRALPNTQWSRQERSKLKIGFISADLRVHPVGWFMLNLLKHIDYERFELVFFSNTRQVDHVSQKIQAYASQWHYIQHLIDEDASKLIALEALDVLVDLSGLTGGNRLNVIATKPARKIVNWLGYFGTTGLSAVDVILADPYCVPPMEDGLYSEKVYRLPATRLCMVPPESAPEVNPLPALHHPDKVIQLASFQEMNKITDEVLVIWWQLIAERSNIHMRFQSKRMGQEPDRFAFTKRLVDIGYDLSRVQLVGAVDRDAYFAVYSSVDFIIDTFPYPGGTTTAEALWMGVPTLTLTGVGMLQRQGEGLLKNVGLADWVCHSTKEMQSKFNSIISADGLQVLADVRQGLRKACQQSALFDGRLFASQWMEVMQAIISER